MTEEVSKELSDVREALIEFEGYDKHGGTDDTLTAARILARTVRAELASRSPTEARGEPVAWKFEHRDFGEVLSLHPMTDGDRSLGWVDTPLYAPHPPAREAVDVTEAMVKAAALSLAEGLDGPYPDDKAWIEYQGFARAALVAALQVKP